MLSSNDKDRGAVGGERIHGADVGLGGNVGVLVERDPGIEDRCRRSSVLGAVQATDEVVEREPRVDEILGRC